MNDMAIQQSDDGQLRELALFAGAGGGILGGKLLGWRTIAAVERDAYAAAILAQRQNDGILSPFPIWSDVSTFDGTRWRGRVDVISGGFPCQDISVAGKGAGITGKRSGLWKEFVRIIREVLPSLVYVENSPALTSRGLGVVLGDLAEMGYDAEWGVLSARDVVAWHERERIWIIASYPYSKINGEQYRNESSRGDYENKNNEVATHNRSTSNSKWPSEPALGRMANGVAFGVDRLKAIGNGQVSRVAATAFIELLRRLEEYP